VLAILWAGAAFRAFRLAARPRGARLVAERANGATIAMGGEGRAGPALLHVRLRRPADVRVILSGRQIHAAETASLPLEVERAGAYRVEARIGGRLWLLSNPVHLR
jgi:hypothetical protein